MESVIDTSQPWHLQLMGHPIDGGALAGPPRPLGDRLFLQPGTIADEGDGLGLTNHSFIPLPSGLLRMSWVVEGYQFWTLPQGGDQGAELRLREPLLLRDLRLEAIPPCGLQLDAASQPSFNVPSHGRNPCPAWGQRVHLYQAPGKPFEATAVIYLDKAERIAAAELYNVALRPLSAEAVGTITQRCWVQFSY